MMPTSEDHLPAALRRACLTITIAGSIANAGTARNLPSRLLAAMSRMSLDMPALAAAIPRSGQPQCAPSRAIRRTLGDLVRELGDQAGPLRSRLPAEHWQRLAHRAYVLCWLVSAQRGERVPALADPICVALSQVGRGEHPCLDRDGRLALPEPRGLPRGEWCHLRWATADPAAPATPVMTHALSPGIELLVGAEAMPAGLVVVINGETTSRMAEILCSGRTCALAHTGRFAA